MLTKWMAAPSSNRSTSSALPPFPPSNQCLPRIQRSPGLVVGSSGGSGTGSGSVSPSVVSDCSRRCSSSAETL